LLLYSSYLPLGVPNWTVIYINTVPHHRAAQDRAAQLDIALQRLQAIYSRPGTSAAVSQESSSSDDTTSSRESGGEEAEEVGSDGAMETSGEASSDSSQGTGDDEGSEEDAP
jgi:hypothetical protein